MSIFLDNPGLYSPICFSRCFLYRIRMIFQNRFFMACPQQKRRHRKMRGSNTPRSLRIPASCAFFEIEIYVLRSSSFALLTFALFIRVCQVNLKPSRLPLLFRRRLAGPRRSLTFWLVLPEKIQQCGPEGTRQTSPALQSPGFAICFRKRNNHGNRILFDA